MIKERKKMRPKVFIARPVPREVEEYIGSYCDYRRWDGEGAIPHDQLFAELNEVEGLLTVGGRVDAELLSHAPKLKVVSNISVGYNNFIIEDMRARRVMGTNTPSVLDETVADLVMGLVLATARRIPELDRYVKEGKWKKGDSTHLFGLDVHHRTMGIIGMGRIGETVAKRAKLGFHMNLLYHNRTRKKSVEESLGVRYAELEDLLKQSDFVVLLTPLTPETTKFIGQNEFAKMKETAIFINASRGKTVDEAALIDALQTGKIRGAGLDVFEQEPVDPDNPLLKMPNVVALPHIGSATAETRLDMAMLAAQNLVKAVLGEEPPNLVEELKNL
jgi:glyoxylate/hydroxypyruvate/2-ketogluconate reductase